MLNFIKSLYEFNTLLNKSYNHIYKMWIFSTKNKTTIKPKYKVKREGSHPIYDSSLLLLF